MTKKISYKAAGVDIEKADRFVAGIGPFVSAAGGQQTSAFGSLFDFKKIAGNYRHPVLVSSADGVGTKLKLAQQFNFHKEVGIDLVAMNVNDVICLGARPLFFLDYIACGKLKAQVLKKVVAGIYQGLEESRCRLLGGETAEMPGMYKENEYDLAGFCLGVADKNQIIRGNKIKEKDKIIGIASSGLHSNGFSLVRKVLSQKELSQNRRALLEPTRIYSRSIFSLFSKNYREAVKGIAHITGGAFYRKATKILPGNLALSVNKGSWPVQAIFQKVQKKGNLSDSEMYSVFNMGIGMLIVVDKNAGPKIIRKLNRVCASYLIGEVVKSREKFILNKK